MSKPVVAIIGRPNVGKSSFFNALIGERVSIVDDMPGVTRDRIYATATWREREFLMIDTGGIEPVTDDILLKSMREQAEIAMETADVILFICDIKSGLTASDHDIAIMLRKSKKPVVVCVNKVDKIGTLPAELYEFYNLGLGDIFPISAAHRLGIGELLDEIYRHFPDVSEDSKDEETIRVALIGKPNAGKSSLSNKMTGEERSIVSDIPGTTRDAIDSVVENPYGSFTIIDTAGLRKKSRIEDSIEKYSMIRSLSDNLILPIAGVILAFVMTLELIQLIADRNNLHDIDTWVFFRWVFKTAAAVLIVSNTWNIVMGVFEAAQSVVNRASGLIVGNTSINLADHIADLEARLLEMNVWSLLGLWLQSFVVGFTMWALTICIFIIIYGRMIEIYLVTSIAPIPMATMMGKEWGGMGQNYLRSLLALAFQGFLIIICIAIYAVLVQNMLIDDNISTAIWLCMGYTVLLCFTLFKTSSLAKSIFNSH